MLAGAWKKVNIWCRENRNDLFVAGIIFFTGLSGFGLGRLSVDTGHHPRISVVQPADEEYIASAHAVDAPGAQEKKVVASRSGAIYYHAWCSGAKRIKEENKMWFPTKEDAEKAGLKPAGNCQ